MKKLISVLFLVAAFAVCGSAHVFAAVPVIDGAISPAGEWANSNSSSGLLPYYLDIVSPPAPNDWVTSMTISHVVLLQELTSNDPTVAFGDQGMYLLIETYAKPQLTYPTPAQYPSIPGMTADLNPPGVQMTGDFTGLGLNTGTNIFISSYNGNPFGAVDNPANDVTKVCVGTQSFCNQRINPGNWTVLTSLGGQYARNGVLEYFFPSSILGSLGYTPFPTSFIGAITYDNGVSSTGGVGSGDDTVTGTLAPEPSTMFLVIAGLLGLVSKKRFLA